MFDWKKGKSASKLETHFKCKLIPRNLLDVIEGSIYLYLLQPFPIHIGTIQVSKQQTSMKTGKNNNI